MTSALSFKSSFHLQNLARPRRECGKRGTITQKLKTKLKSGNTGPQKKCGKILWPQKGQEKGFERRQVVWDTRQGQRYKYPNEPKLPFSHTNQDSSALKGEK